MPAEHSLGWARISPRVLGAGEVTRIGLELFEDATQQKLKKLQGARKANCWQRSACAGYDTQRKTDEK
jgi:hypothetical protein